MTGRVRPLVAVLLIGLSACRFSDLEFRQRHDIEITMPIDGATVTTPIHVEWTVDRDPEDDGSRSREIAWFAAFVDRAPIRRGQSLDGSPEDLANQSIFITTSTSLDIPFVRETRDDEHEVIIVPLDEDMRRIGEQSYSRTFSVDR